MIQPESMRVLNSKNMIKGKYVLYWMQQSQRSEYNHALEYAIDRGNELSVPVEETSPKEEFTAGTFRPKIRKKLSRYSNLSKSACPRKTLSTYPLNRLILALTDSKSTGVYRQWTGLKEGLARQRVDSMLSSNKNCAILKASETTLPRTLSHI
jgi:hypothetical protein